MSQKMMETQAEKMKRNVPEIKPGYTVRVHQKVQEGDKERVQIFEGMVIGVHGGHNPMDSSFTVRKIASGVGVEKVFPLHSPAIDKVEVKKIARIRRAKLNFLRGRSGKKARISERLTSSGEFEGLLTPQAPPAATEDQIVEAPKADDHMPAEAAVEPVEAAKK